MKKVVMILTNRYDPDVRVYKEAKYLVKQGFNVEILCWDRENHYPKEEFVEIQGIKIKRFYPFSKYGSGLKQFFPFIKFIVEVKRYLKNEKIDFIHSHDLDGAIVGYLLQKKDTIKVFDMHEYYEIQGSKRRIKSLIRFIVNHLQSKFSYTIYVNEEQLKNVKERNKEKLVYLPNYPEVEEYEKFERKESDNLRISYIGAVRQYSELKNLMDAVKDLSQVTIHIHGEGVAYKRLKELSANYKNVEVTGVFNYEKAGELYSETDLLYAVYPIDNYQNRIAYPVKFFEAIASKTPIIVSKGTILEEEVIKNNIGFVVNNKSVKDLFVIITNLLEDKQLLQEKRSNMELIQEKYQWKTIVDNLNKIYSQ